MDFCCKLGVRQQEITEEKRHSCNRQIKAMHGPSKCEEGKGSPGVSQGKYFQQESVKHACMLHSSHRLFEKNDEFILQQ